MRVAVLGAPNRRGLRVMRDLLERPEVSSVLLVGPNERDLARLVGAHDTLRVSAAAVPLTLKGISGAIAGADVALGCLDGGGEAELAAFEAALATGTPYVSACEDPETIEAMLRREPKSHAAAIAVPNMSWTPGISNLLVRAAAESLDSAQAVRIAWSVSRRDEGGDGLERLLAAWSSEAAVVEHGQRRSRPAGTGAHRVFFPQPVAWQRVSLVRGTEVLTLPELLDDLDSLVVEGGTDSGSMAAVARAAARTASAPGGRLGRAGRARLGILTRSAAAGLGPPAPGAGWSALRVDVRGRSGGFPRVATLGIVDHLSNLETAPLVVAGLMAGAGEVEASGIASPESAFDPRRFFIRLGERGVRAARLER